MASSVRVNGKTFSLFKQLDISRSKDDFSGEARITVSESVNDESFIKNGDLIEILLDGIHVLTGYAEKISDSESNDSHDISFRARDKVQDLIDSTVPDNVKNLENVTSFKEIVQLCIDGLGLTGQILVIDNVNIFFDSKIKAASVGQNCGEFLQEYARKAQVFLNTDGKGNVLIQKNAGKHITLLLNIPNNISNNIKSSNLSIDYSKRFNKYTIRSNNTMSSDNASTDDLNNSGIAFDNEIRPSRRFEKLSDTPMTKDECKKAAEEEANIRRARSFSYSCSIAGFSANGELWQPGKTVNITDTKKGISGLFLVNKATWSDSAAGDITNLDITYPDKLSVDANPSIITTKTTEDASTYIVQKGDSLADIAYKRGIKLDDLISSNPQIENPRLIFPDDTIIIPIGGIN